MTNHLGKVICLGALKKYSMKHAQQTKFFVKNLSGLLMLTYGMLSHTDALGLRHPLGRHISRPDLAVSLVLFMTSLDQGGYAYLTQSG